jgi:pyruvate/2-oxoglutarate dehydrogenase complex dihydrolipoamide acyltransferase (E2) component
MGRYIASGPRRRRPISSCKQQDDDWGSRVSTEIKLPMLSMGMEEAILSEWLVADGDAVAEGMPLYALESDKSIQEVEATVSGTLTIIGQAGETYKVGDLIGLID